MTIEEADALVRKVIDPFSPIHDRSLDISEMDESVKKFYPDAAQIYDASARLTPTGARHNISEQRSPKEVHFADRNASKLGPKSSLAELVKVASEVALMQGPLTAH